MDGQPEKSIPIIQESLSPSELASEIGLGYYRCSRDGKVLEVNELLATLLEYKSKDELISSGVPANLNKNVLDKISFTSDTSIVTPALINLKTKKGNIRWLEVTYRSVKGEQDQPVFNEGFVKDLTERISELNTLKNDNLLLKGIEEHTQIALSKSQTMISRLVKEISSPSEELLNMLKYFNKKILLIDDDVSITEAFGDYFKEKGFLVALANNGNDALSIFQSFKPDIIISDIMMPGMDGLTLQEKIRDINPEQKIILITGDRSKESTKELMNIMGITMLFKPINVRVELWNAVTEQLGIAAGG